MSRPAIYTPEEARRRKNDRRIEAHRQRMAEDPEYRAWKQAYWRDWYAKQGKAAVTAGVDRWRRANPQRYIFGRKKNEVTTSGRHEWALEFTDVVWPTHCPALGIELDYGKKPKGHASDNSPSLDRLDSSRGYVKGNVLVVSCLANRIKNSSTPAQLAAVAAFYASLTPPPASP